MPKALLIFFQKNYIFYLLNINRLALFTKVFFKYHLDNPNTAPIFAPQLRNDGNKPNILDCGVEQLVARWAHNPKATGSSPVPATTKPHENIVFMGFLVFTSYSWVTKLVKRKPKESKKELPH